MSTSDYGGMRERKKLATHNAARSAVPPLRIGEMRVCGLLVFAAMRMVGWVLQRRWPGWWTGPMSIAPTAAVRHAARRPPPASWLARPATMIALDVLAFARP